MLTCPASVIAECDLRLRSILQNSVSGKQEMVIQEFQQLKNRDEGKYILSIFHFVSHYAGAAGGAGPSSGSTQQPTKTCAGLPYDSKPPEWAANLQVT